MAFHIFDSIKNNKTYIIAEMSANHGGSLDHALELVHAAKDAGADCLKIQTYTADTITINSHRPEFKVEDGLWKDMYLYDLYQKAYTPWEWQPTIKEECDKVGIDFLSTPFDPTAVDFLEKMGCEAYKIASYELVDIPLIEYTAKLMKPMIMSTGMASIEEIQEAIDACRRVGNDQIVLLKCCSEYPTNWHDMHLADIPDMVQKFRIPVGLSDHSAGSIASVVGVSLGACVVEKHIMLEDVKSEDSGFSMTVNEFGDMVKAVRSTKKIIGNVYYGPTATEDINCRRSIYAVENIHKGEKFTQKNARSIRPANGLKPKYYSQLLNTVAKRDIEAGEPITEEDL